MVNGIAGDADVGVAVIRQYRIAAVSVAGAARKLLDSIAFVDPELQKNVAAALSRLASHRSDGRRRLTLESRGTGSRSIRVGYVVEVPLWKASYRLNLPGDPKADRARLQGWAILENFSGQAWHDVSLTLLSGNPVTFRQSLFPHRDVPPPKDCRPFLDAVDGIYLDRRDDVCCRLRFRE